MDYFNGARLVVETPRDPVYSLSGANATLPCRYRFEPQQEGKRKIRIKWSKLRDDYTKEQDVLVAIGKTYMAFGDFRGRAHLQQGGRHEASLLVSDVRLQDDGKYRCEVIDGLEDESDVVDLRLQGGDPCGAAGCLWGQSPAGPVGQKGAGVCGVILGAQSSPGGGLGVPVGQLSPWWCRVPLGALSVCPWVRVSWQPYYCLSIPRREVCVSPGRSHQLSQCHQMSLASRCWWPRAQRSLSSAWGCCTLGCCTLGCSLPRSVGLGWIWGPVRAPDGVI